MGLILWQLSRTARLQNLRLDDIPKRVKRNRKEEQEPQSSNQDKEFPSFS